MSSPIRRVRPLLTAAGLFALLTTGSTAWSQETVYIGGGGPASRGDVRVDMSVLDDLNRSGTSAAPGQRVILTPPSQKAATPHKSTAKAKPATTRKATAAKPAAPKSSTTGATAKAAAPAPNPVNTVVAAQAPQPAPQARTASSDLPPPPPEPIEISMPPAAAPITPAAPKAVVAVAAPATAVAAAKSSDPVAPVTKPTPASAPARVAAQEPAVRVADPTPSSEPSPNPRAAAAAEAPAMAVAAAQPTAPVAKPEPAAKPAPAPTQTASLASAPQSASTGSSKQSLRIAFAGEAATLPEPAKPDLKSVAGALSQDPALRVQVMAYAGGSDDASKARRLSLSRALAVRSYLIEQGIGSTRIDVRALGNATEGGPADRVDLMVLSR